MTWFPLPSEAFVFRNKIRGDEAVLMLVPGGKGPETVMLDGEPYEYDFEKTMQYRVAMGVTARRREIALQADTR